MKDSELIKLNRRRFIELGGLALYSAALAACDSRGPMSARGLLTLAERKNEQVERWLFRRRSLDRVPGGARDAGKAFPTYFVSKKLPMLDEAGARAWRLEVGGAVKQPASFSLDDLVRLPSRTQRVNHYCVEGWNAVATWRGVRLSEIARLVQPTAAARYVDFESFDAGYHESWDADSALHPQTLIAYAMDGRFLNANHGAPARLHSPVKLGYKNVKYLTRIMFSPVRTGGYWTDRGYEWYGGT